MNISKMFKNPDLGLLIIRLVFGLAFIYFGVAKFMQGTAGLEQLGSATKALGVNAFPLFFGIVAAGLELVGGLLVVLGYKFRWGAFAIFLVMVVAFISQFDGLASIVGKSLLPLEIGALFLGLFFIGPGRYSIDRE